MGSEGGWYVLGTETSRCKLVSADYSISSNEWGELIVINYTVEVTFTEDKSNTLNYRVMLLDGAGNEIISDHKYTLQTLKVGQRVSDSFSTYAYRVTDGAHFAIGNYTTK